MTYVEAHREPKMLRSVSLRHAGEFYEPQHTHPLHGVHPLRTVAHSRTQLHCQMSAQAGNRASCGHSQLQTSPVGGERSFGARVPDHRVLQPLEGVLVDQFDGHFI
jgi:hypothetical protein